LKKMVELARGRAPGGGVLSLHRRDDELIIRVDGQELMSSRRHGSEDALATVGCGGLGPAARVLIGGLGMGFTLRAALAVVAPRAEVVVAEVSADVVAWNRERLGPEAAAGLADPRVQHHVGDVADLLRAPGAGFDAILLDVDNSPHALSLPGNAALYGAAGLAAARRALRRAGRLAVWSASRHPEFERRLAAAGFAVEVHAARAHGGGRGSRHTIYLGVA